VNTPVLSILLPVRNEERHLPAALRSLQRQTLSDWEMVAVDDGSSDGTAAILADVAASDRRIRIISLPPTGIVGALNAGLAKCRASVVARMDGDDISHPLRLERQFGYLYSYPEIGLVACGTRHFPRHDLQGGMLHYEGWQNALTTHEEIVRDLYVESPFAHPSVMFRRDLAVSAGGYRECGWAEDYDLWLRMAASGVRFARISENLFFWRDRPERLTRTAENCFLDAFRDCKAHHLSQGFLEGEDSVILWGAGMEGKAWRKALLKVGIRVGLWIEIDPRKIGQTIHGASVCAPDALRAGGGKTLVTVGAKGARSQVRCWAQETGLREGEDFLCVT